jgi:hypothetical protein
MDLRMMRSPCATPSRFEMATAHTLANCPGTTKFCAGLANLKLSGYLGLGDAKSRSTFNKRALGISRHIFGGHFTFPIARIGLRPVSTPCLETI